MSYSEKKALLRKKLELMDFQLKNVLENKTLKNSTDVIELQIERLALLDKLRYLRPTNSEDIAYRENIVENFSKLL